MRFALLRGLVLMGLQRASSSAPRRSPRLAAEVHRKSGSKRSSSSSVAFAAGISTVNRRPCTEGRSRTRRSSPSSRLSPPSPCPASTSTSRTAAAASSAARKEKESELKGVVAAPGKPGNNSSGGPPDKQRRTTTLGRSREKRKRSEGFGMVIGVDEAGRGPFAGPVVAAACFVPPDVNIAGITDSKQVKAHSRREELYKELTESPGVVWATSEVGSRRIDEINILEATKEAMTECALGVISKASKASSNSNGNSNSNGKDKNRRASKRKGGEDDEAPKPYVLVDGNFTPPGLAEVDCESVVGGDGLEYCVAAASIIAKVTRDRLMIEFGERWPLYGFERHMGYGTKAHRDAIREHGMVEIHRRSFLKKMEAAGGKLKEHEG